MILKSKTVFFGIMLTALAAFAAEICEDDPITRLPAGTTFDSQYVWEFRPGDDYAQFYHSYYVCRAFKDGVDEHHPIEIKKRTFTIGKIDVKNESQKQTVVIPIVGDKTVTRVECARDIPDDQKPPTIANFFERTRTPFLFNFTPVTVKECHKPIQGSVVEGENVLKLVTPVEIKSKSMKPVDPDTVGSE